MIYSWMITCMNEELMKEQLSACDYNVSDEDQVHAILNGVDKDYDVVHPSVSGRSDDVTVKEIIVCY